MKNPVFTDHPKLPKHLRVREMTESKNDFLRFQVGISQRAGTPFETFELKGYGYNIEDAVEMALRR